MSAAGLAVVHVVDDDILNPIIDSQVFRPLANDTRAAVRCVVAVVASRMLWKPALRAQLKAASRRRLERYGIETTLVLKRLPGLDITGWAQRRLRQLLTRWRGNDSVLEVHGRNSTATGFILEALGEQREGYCVV